MEEKWQCRQQKGFAPIIRLIIKKQMRRKLWVIVRKDRKRQEKNGTIVIIVCILAFVLDIILVNVLKGNSSMCRWLWLPLISLVLAVIASGVSCINPYVGDGFGLPAIIWGIIRGIIVVVAYFKASSGFFAILGAIFFCIFIFVLNAFPFVTCGSIMMSSDDDPKASSTAKSYSQSPQPKKWSQASTNKDVERASWSRQGNLTSYFHSYACAPQSGSMYFWQSSPSMSSSYGSHSSYVVSGTIGIRKQSIEAFHITSTDMDHYLDSVKRDVSSYVNGIISDYRRDYPNDKTDFSIDVNLKLDVVG